MVLENYSRSPTVQSLVETPGGPGVAPVPSVGGHLGGCPSRPGELAEVVAGQVERPLDGGQPGPTSINTDCGATRDFDIPHSPATTDQHRLPTRSPRRRDRGTPFAWCAFRSDG